MGKRTTIGLLFAYNENWIGGSYYIINLIQSINLLEDDKKPKLVILSNKKDDFESIKKINYPYIKYKLIARKKSIIARVINKIEYKTKINFNWFESVFFKIDLFFPATEQQSLGWIKNKLYWIPDFQEKHLPHFFTKAILENRENMKQKISLSKKFIVFSSQDALNDYNTFYPKNNTTNYVLNFSVFHPDFSDLDQNVLKKYNLENKKYFFSPNQFWKHKNQIVVLKALLKLKETNELDFTIAFSGKEYDHRNPNYFQELKDFIQKNDLEKNVLFLGFIDRKEQLYLMKNALAIIQPSLFEGWSSVVEDTKRLNQNCIVTNLKVHQEQLGDRAFYFDPYDENQLATILLNFRKNTVIKPNFNYQNESKLFGVNFMKIVNGMLNI